MRRVVREGASSNAVSLWVNALPRGPAMRRHDMLRLQRFTRGGASQRPTRLASGARRIHYAWVIVAVASLICMIISPMRFAISMLVPHLQNPQGFGWSYFEISVAFALQWLCSA